MSNFAMRTHPLRSPYDDSVPTHVGLSNHRTDHLRTRVETKGLPGVTRDREALQHQERGQRPYDMVYFPSDQMAGVVQLKRTQTARTHRASEAQMKLAPRRSVEHNGWGLGQPWHRSTGSSPGGSGSGPTSCLSLGQPSQSPPAAAPPPNYSPHPAMVNKTYRTVGVEEDRRTLGNRWAQQRKNSTGLGEGVGGHTLEIMRPSRNQPTSAAEGYCFAHREGSGRGDPAVQGEGRSEGKAHHRARVSWRAKGQRTQIEAPFAMNEAGHIGLIGLRGGPSREIDYSASSGPQGNEHYLDLHRNRNLSMSRSTPEPLAVAAVSPGAGVPRIDMSSLSNR